ncbi:hypothetical protein [Streptomyces mexicanus]|nr:hypothetical protein [Streptomyces mexicanus]
MIFALFALAVVGLGNGNVSAGSGTSPRPQSTVRYPVRFDDVPVLRVQKPQPTVSYPIRFPAPEGHR